VAKREDRARGRALPWPHKGLTQPPWTELMLSLFYLFIYPSLSTHPPPPRPLRTSACILFQLVGGQCWERKRTDVKEGAEQARQTAAAPLWSWFPANLGLRDIGRGSHGPSGQQGTREVDANIGQPAMSFQEAPYWGPLSGSEDKGDPMLRQKPTQNSALVEGDTERREFNHG
jgi:hypothetical protein